MKTWQSKKILGLSPLIFGISIILVVIICILVIFSIHEYKDVKARGVFDNRNPVSDGFFKKHPGEKKELESVDQIEDWMTFGYINFTFGLPDDYLKNILHIDDTKYPKVPISKYVRKNKLSKDIFLQEVRKAVEDWKKAHPKGEGLKGNEQKLGEPKSMQSGL